jgi:hypothetical protein
MSLDSVPQAYEPDRNARAECIRYRGLTCIGPLRWLI